MSPGHSWFFLSILFAFVCYDSHDWIEMALWAFWGDLCTRIRVVLNCIHHTYCQLRFALFSIIPLSKR